MYLIYELQEYNKIRRVTTICQVLRPLHWPDKCILIVTNIFTAGLLNVDFTVIEFRADCFH